VTGSASMKFLIPLLLLCSSACAIDNADASAAQLATVHTTVVPVIGPTNDVPGARPAGVFSTASQLYVPLFIDVGQTLSAVRARIQDSAVGPTKVRFAVASTIDFARTPSLITTSTISNGSGTEQTIFDTDFPGGLVTPGKQFWAIFQTTTGAAQGAAFRLEIDTL